MNQNPPMKIIARIRSDFPTKFGIPRQSGLIEELSSTVVFEPEFRNAASLRGIEEYSHIWLIWQFSEALRDGWTPTVRPPRLGGNTRVGVFATRSPFRPNPIGLSCVRLESVEQRAGLGTVLRVRGGDLMDGTPIFDIKPYLPLADCQPGAEGGFSERKKAYALEVEIPGDCLQVVPQDRREALRLVLRQDPRPSYQKDPERVYGFVFAGLEIRFTVEDELLSVKSIEPQK